MLVLNVITFLNLLLIFCFLFFKKDNPLPNKILALLLLNPGINFLSNANILSGNLPTFPYLYFFAQFTCLFFAPLVFIYVNLLIGEKIKLKHPLYYLTAITLIYMVYCTVEFAVMSPAQQSDYLNGILHEPYPLQMVILNAAFILLQQAYFTAAAIKVYRYRKNLPNIFSNFEKTKLSFVIKFITLIWILNLITIGLYSGLPTIEVEYIYLPIVLIIIHSFILYFSFHHHSIFTQVSYETFLSDNYHAPVEVNILQETKNSLDNEVKEIASKLEDFLNQKKLYINPDLTLALLSEELNINSRKVSLAINTVFAKNFYDYINEKRVELSKELLIERKEIAIEGIGYESGFSSRASFYRAFKKHTGQTPSQYLEDIQNGTIEKITINLASSPDKT